MITNRDIFKAAARLLAAERSDLSVVVAYTRNLAAEVERTQPAIQTPAEVSLRAQVATLLRERDAALAKLAEAEAR